MIAIISFILGGFAVLLAVPTGVFLFEVMAGCFLPTREIVAGPNGSPRSAIAVLVPAHNEATGLQATLEDLKRELRSEDRLLVVADNCTDETATVAASLGAEVSVRTDLTKIGKGYALDWGLTYLSADPPGIVIVVDADCRIVRGTIDRLARVCAELRRPVQSLYLMTASPGSPISHQVAEFAWRIKNRLRPLGLSALSLPCQLMGTGMAFPWETIRSADLLTGSIVEDLKLGLELAIAGHPPVFCPSAIVSSAFPNSIKGAERQRQRWEHGHLGLISTKAPLMLHAAFKQRNLNLLALALDLIVLPLSLFGLILTAAVAAMGTATIVVGAYPYAFIISLTCLIVTIGTTFIAWLKCGRDILPPSSFVLIAFYFAAKLRLYGAALCGHRISRWIRADRN